jgi:uncharacterized membrane protein
MVQRLRNIETMASVQLAMQMAKLAFKKRQLETSRYKDHNSVQVKSPHIDWPILTFWLTYFGIMFGILCGLISAGM